ncbi:uncharacterized protein LOC144338170 isoform X3 [Macaca mulatta]
MFFFIKERNQLFRTGPHLSSGAISVLHRPAELGALYGDFQGSQAVNPADNGNWCDKTLSSLKYPSWRVRTPHEERTNHTELSYGTHSGT